MPNVQNIEVYAGEDRTVTLTARDSSNNVVNLTGKTLAFNVGRRPNDPTLMTAVLTYTGSTVSTTAGTYTVAIVAGDTDDLTPGNYQHQTDATTVSTGALSVVCIGVFRIRGEVSN